MKKIIFLCLLFIISCVNIYAIHEVKAQEKVKELCHHKFSKAKARVSLTTEILSRYLAFRTMCTVE